MSESVRLLKGIMKTSGWTQEQVAEKLDVSFQTMNAWINGRTKPRRAMIEKIRKLYLAQDVTRDTEPTYVTIIDRGDCLEVGDALLFEKCDGGVRMYRFGFNIRRGTQLLDVRIANLTDDKVKGTSALEQIEGKFNKIARAKVLFLYNGLVVARVVEWGNSKIIQKGC